MGYNAIRDDMGPSAEEAETITSSPLLDLRRPQRDPFSPSTKGPHTDRGSGMILPPHDWEPVRPLTPPSRPVPWTTVSQPARHGSRTARPIANLRATKTLTMPILLDGKRGPCRDVKAPRARTTNSLDKVTERKVIGTAEDSGSNSEGRLVKDREKRKKPRTAQGVSAHSGHGHLEDGDAGAVDG